MTNSKKPQRGLDDVERQMKFQIGEYKRLEEVYGEEEGQSQKALVSQALSYLRRRWVEEAGSENDMPAIPERMLPSPR